MAADRRGVQPSLTALIAAAPKSADGSKRVLTSPAVGIWRDAPAPGSLIGPGSYLGQIAILGVLHRLYAPKGAHGIAALAAAADSPDGQGDSALADDALLRAVGYGDPLLVLDPEGVTSAADQMSEHRSAGSAASDGELAFRAPMSGRFYYKPSPDKPPFVQAGDEIAVGATVGLLEVMKTFNRVTYGGDDLPERAVVIEVVPEDQADLSTNDVILRIRRP